MSQILDMQQVAILGAGTMGSGIAGLCAEAGCQVVLLDISREASAQALLRLCKGKNPVIESNTAAARIQTGSFDEDMELLGDADWICEVIVEDLALKQTLLQKVAKVCSNNAIISTNTSGIPLRDICAGLPLTMRQHMAVTHFFNPVKFMRLLELIPGADAKPEVIARLASFCRNRLCKGVVNAKDTVNFIGNRVGCFWILSGLAAGKRARAKGLDLETIDALLGEPVGLPKTGLYGLVDLIGLDVMHLVGLNLKTNLPDNDPGMTYAGLPAEEQAMLDRGQLGRKTGGGYYRLLRHDDGSKSMEVYNPDQDSWRAMHDVQLSDEQQTLSSLLRATNAGGELAWAVMSSTMCYAANLVPEIADDIVNIDRAMRWGFNWQQGPFELIDRYGAAAFAGRLKSEQRPQPAMLKLLLESGNSCFYKGNSYFGLDKHYQPMPEE